MKQLLLFLSLFFLTINIYAKPQGSTKNLTSNDKSPSQIFYSSPLTFENQKSINNLIATVPSYPTFGTIENKQTLYQGIQNRQNKATVPPKINNLLQASKLTLLKTAPDAFKHYPKGIEIFKNYPEVAEKFDAMINGFIANPDFIPLFRKVHINVLNELYHYLMGIFMNFNLHHPGIVQNSSGDLQVNISNFITSEDDYDMNKKTMIINHLIAIIESQFNSAIRSYTPHIPQSFATYIGKIAIQNDYSTNLTHLIIEQIEPELQNFKSSSLRALASYVEFFHLMTNYLNKQNTKGSTNFSSFVNMAEDINNFLYADTQSNQSIIAEMKTKTPSVHLQKDLELAKQKFAPHLKNTINPIKTAPLKQLQSTSQLFSDDNFLIALKKMNPPILNFRYDDMRAIKIIPYLAKKLSAQSKSIKWPEHIVEAANEGLIYNPHEKPHPIAYFKTKDNLVVKNYNNDQSSDLYICMRLGDNIFEQILIAQPDWLNSWDGIFKIMRACYGDFTAIAGMGILDPVMEALITNVQLVQKGKDPLNSGVVYQKAQDLINTWKDTPRKSNTAIAFGSTKSNEPTLSSLPELSQNSLPNITDSLLEQP
ncbi:hypothetical protein HYV10_01850 [Candidatus Dependentiae bacterium]|nr:hypothetical protein [Candidatus Dependentiae bacterium]